MLLHIMFYIYYTIFAASHKVFSEDK